ncbi:MAG: ribose transport system substrate-binding protein [Alphaproteobacteria bacterium]|nr:ribose transport system substrate-binding protein [Alphaproteobacteria bacterium]
MIRGTLALITTLGISLLTSADANADPQGKKIAFLVTSPTHPFIAALSKTFITRANSFGMEVNTVSQHFDAALQAQQVDDAIARKFDVLAIIAGSEQAIIPALSRAKQAGVPVILINSPPRDGSEDLYLSFVGEDHVELGRITGLSVLQALKDGAREGGKVALITGSLQEGVGPRRVAGFREAMKTNPKAQIVSVEDAKWQTDLSERIAGQLFARFAVQGGLDAIYGMADNQAAAIIQAAKSANIALGIEKGKLIVVGSNCLKQGIAGIKAGEQYSTGTQVPTRTGLKAAEMIADYFNGRKLPKNEILPVETITKANVARWEEACSY